MNCPICDGTKITHTVTGVWPCLKCKKEPKKSKLSSLHCMFDGEKLIKLNLGFLKCPTCLAIFSPSVISGGRQKLEEVYQTAFEGE